MKDRINKLLLKMQELKIDAMLVGSKSNRMYLSGFTGSNAMLYISSKKQIIITDFRYIEQAGEQCTHFQVINQSDLGLIKTAVKIAQEEGDVYIGFESAHTNYTTYMELAAHHTLKLVPTLNVAERLRQIKDEDELQRIRKAEQIGDSAFEYIVPFIQDNLSKGLTENNVALELESIMRQKGAAGTSFTSIVAAGAKSSLPHAEPGNSCLKSGDFVVMDFGCIYQGYCSDMTRTIVIGEPNEKQQLIYNTVLKAQLAALDAIKPGKCCSEIDKTARDIISEAGFKEAFGHGLGHSLGIDIHESPRFSPLDTSITQKGMVMTVEPGIYIPHFGGVRIEDLVLITEDGCENLTHSPKKLIVV